MTQTHLITTPTTGRYLMDPAPQAAAPLLVGFHGYAQRAEDLLEDLRRIPGAATCTLVAVQALHRFYSPKAHRVVGSWMTSLDRDRAIEDNLAYVRNVIADLRRQGASGALLFAGFSQGAAMAWRAAAHGGPCAGLIILGGDLPEDVAGSPALALPPVLLGRGLRDTFYTAPQLEKDLAALEALDCRPERVAFEGGHEWGPDFLEAAGRFLARLSG